MKRVKKIAFCFIIVSLSVLTRTDAQQVSAKPNTTTRQTANEKTELNTGAGNKETGEKNEKAETKPAKAEQTYPEEKKKWQIIVTTGEKWYQLSVKLVM